MVVCPNFGHPVLTLLSIKYKFLQVRNSFATIVNRLSVLTFVQFSKGDLLFSLHEYSIYKVQKLRMTKLGYTDTTVFKLFKTVNG